MVWDYWLLVLGDSPAPSSTRNFRLQTLLCEKGCFRVKEPALGWQHEPWFCHPVSAGWGEGVFVCPVPGLEQSSEQATEHRGHGERHVW